MKRQDKQDMATDYTTVTEVPGNKVTRDQIARMFHRYCFAASFCERKDVLEVACGAGQGLGYLTRRARRVVGGDCTDKLVQSAKEYYKDRVEIHLLDAHQLPFEDESFDVVILYEAIYYLGQPEKFLDESRRVLREKGILLICTVNKEWSDFNPSPYSTKYFSAYELYRLLNHEFPVVELYGAFAASPNSTVDKITSVIKRSAVALHLMPKTMKGKELFKRLFFGELIPLGAEIKDGMAGYSPPVPIPCDSPNYDYKVLYAVARA